MFFHTDLHTLIALFVSRKCLVIFAATPETAEIINEKMTEVELELLENEEMTLAEDKIQVLLEDQQETEEALLEEMKIQLTGKPVQVFAYRNMKGDIDEGNVVCKSDAYTCIPPTSSHVRKPGRSGSETNHHNQN